MENYSKQAKDFLSKTNTTFKATFLKYDKHFDSDTEKRDIYKITLKRGNREYIFNFGQSISCSMQWTPNSIYAKNQLHKLGFPRLMGETKINMLRCEKLPLFGWNSNDFIKNKNFSEPTEYDVLACLVKYDPETFEDFCFSYGYNEDSIKAYKVYESVVNEWNNVAMLWSELEIEELQEIQ